jgi:hypothetical protein
MTRRRNDSACDPQQASEGWGRRQRFNRCHPCPMKPDDPVAAHYIGAVHTATRLLACAVVLGIWWPDVTVGQAPPGSRIVPVGEWSYEYIQRLRTRGYLDNLVPIAQPYRRHEVARGLVGIDPDTMPRPVADWIRLLQAEFKREIERIRGAEVPSWGIPVTADVRASSSQRTDPLRPIGDADVWGRYTAGAWVEQGIFSSEVRLSGDQQLESDPDAPIDQGRLGQVDNGCLSLSFSFADVWFGRLKHNWTTLGTRSLFVSDIPTAYPALSFEIRVGRFALRALTGELETLTDSEGNRHKRYLSAARLEYRTKDFVASLGDGILFASTSGFMLRFLNPLEGAFLQVATGFPGEEPKETVENAMLDAQLWFRLFGRLEFSGEGLLDDIDIDAASGTRAPTRYAFYLRLRAPGLLRAIDAELSYRQVAAFTYRTNRIADKYTFLDRGLGDNFVDYDRLTVAGTWHPPLGGLELTPFFQFQRQGEGNLRDPFPVPYSDFVSSPSIFLGVVEKTYRFGLAGRFQPIRYVWFAWDVGANVVRNAGNQAGVESTDLEGIVGAGLSLPLPF